MSKSTANFEVAPQGLLIFGFGGHARSVADIALAVGIHELCFVETAAKAGEVFLGFEVVNEWQKPLPDNWMVFPASGDNLVRQAYCELFETRQWPIATLIAPTASIGIASQIEPGTVVNHQAHIGPLVRVGKGCIINTGALVDHESVIGDFCHVSVNTTVAGRCHIGARVFLGAGATIIDKITIPDDVIIGAGAVVSESLNLAGTYVGIPAKRIPNI